MSRGFNSQFVAVRPAYDIPEDDLIGEVLVPAMRLCDEVRIEAGFFSSRCLSQIAPGLAAFINDTNGVVDLMVSPEISHEDQEAIRKGVIEPQAVLDNAMASLLESARLSTSAIERHTVETLAYLLASNRLRMRVVLMHDRGMYHRKLWLFRSGNKWLAVHGSGNATERGLLVNGEQMSVDRAWADGTQSERRVAIFLENWARRWNNHHRASLTVDILGALSVLRSCAGLEPPTTDDFWNAWREDYEAGLEPPLPIGYTVAPARNRLNVPQNLKWREGRFAHQGLAVDAILAHGGGILSIATGGGKTRTALIAATELQDLSSGHMCIVVIVPTTPLLKQWTDDVQEFGIMPVVLSGMSPRKRSEELTRLSIAFGSDQPRTEVLLLTNQLFSRQNSGLRDWLEGLPDSVLRLLIADEVHHLGTKSFTENQPGFFEYRIGLSATPIRQYDPDGTDQLFDFFGGPPVFNFTLRDAIDAGCLVPYRYYLHVVDLNAEEMDYYEELTRSLAQAGFKTTDAGKTIGLTPRVEAILRTRRALVEQAASKVEALEKVVYAMEPSSITKTLIFTSAKPVAIGETAQIKKVNKMLNRLGVTSHGYTNVETQSTQSQAFLDRFDSGDYQALTAMKVLDEGVDIPETDTAFLLASSTVEREWIQRRGRILRTAPGKEYASLHDFIVVPPDRSSPAGKSLLRSELRRASSFADLAENEYDPGGPRAVIRDLESSIKVV